MTKYFRMTVRFTQNEKTILEKRASNLGITLSEYARFQLLSDVQKTPNNEALEWLNKNYKEVFRTLLNGSVLNICKTQIDIKDDLFNVLEQKCIETYEELGLKRDKPCQK